MDFFIYEGESRVTVDVLKFAYQPGVRMGFPLQKTSRILKFEFLNIDASGCITVVIWNAADFLSVDIRYIEHCSWFRLVNALFS
jgi:hypothetical protein